jgi:hypothetical protein
MLPAYEHLLLRVLEYAAKHGGVYGVLGLILGASLGASLAKNQTAIIYTRFQPPPFVFAGVKFPRPAEKIPTTVEKCQLAVLHSDLPDWACEKPGHAIGAALGAVLGYLLARALLKRYGERLSQL